MIRQITLFDLVLYRGASVANGKEIPPRNAEIFLALLGFVSRFLNVITNMKHGCLITINSVITRILYSFSKLTDIDLARYIIYVWDSVLLISNI